MKAWDDLSHEAKNAVSRVDDRMFRSRRLKIIPLKYVHQWETAYGNAWERLEHLDERQRIIALRWYERYIHELARQLRCRG